LPRILRLQYAENTGAAFSLFNEYPAILAVIATGLAALVLAWSWFLPERERLSRAALGLIFGGAVGNLIDRFRYGFVVDFIQVHCDGRPLWPTFNLADSAICVGIALFFLSSWAAVRAQRPATPSDPAQAPAPAPESHSGSEKR
jgi:signal peptidase II